MHLQYTPYELPVVIAATITIALAFAGWHRRRAPGATAFAVLMLAVSQWSLGYALELASADLQSKIFWANFKYLGVVSAPTAWLIFVLQYTNQATWLTRRNLMLMAIEPFAILLLVWTDEAHGLIRGNVALNPPGEVSLLNFNRGPVFWLNVAYSYWMLLLGTFLLVQALVRSPNLYRGQARSLLMSALAPWTGNILYNFGLSPFPHLDLTPFAFVVSGVALIWGVFRFGLLDIVPVARDAVIESMSDAVMVLDEQSRIIDLNPAAERIIGYPIREVFGRPAAQVLAQWPDLLERYGDAINVRAEIVLHAGVQQLHFELCISPLHDRRGRLIGRLVVLGDITERKQAEEALRASEERFRQIFEEVPLGMAVVSPDGTLFQVNKACCEMLGYTEHELKGRSFLEITHPMDADEDAYLAEQVLQGAIPSYKLEKRYIKKNGDILWADLTATVIRGPTGQIIYGLGMIENIIQRKWAELLEDERRQVAYELHDGLAQVATSSHQYLQAFASHYQPTSPQARHELARALELGQRTIREARRMIAGLRPTALDELGLATALKIHVEALSADGWKIAYDEELGSERLPASIETALFRVAQEALTNVRKHAQTTHVHLTLQRRRQTIYLEIQDWGCGFQPSTACYGVRPGEQVGLRSMQERIALLGGRFTIHTQPGAGTLVVAEVPLPAYTEKQMYSEKGSSYEARTSVAVEV